MSYTSGKPPPKAFISYKWEDDAHNNWVKRLATDLRNAGIEAILDRWEVRLGDSFTDYMTSKINEAGVVLFIITAASVAAVESPKGKGGAVKFEMQMATARRTAGERVRLIGIYREGDKTPLYLRDHRYADFRDDSRYEESLRELVADLKGEIPIPPVAGQSAIESPKPKMVLIPAGEFQMGSYGGRDDEKPVHTVYLDAFYMDIYAVTSTQYREFMDATGYKPPRWWDDPRINVSDHPVVGVTWHDAAAYAKWAGKRLPTEAEWEKAARGGFVGKKYPRGNKLTHDDANYSGTGGKDKWEYTSPVGSFDPNGYGLYDMAGNVWEWCADWYDGDYYSRYPERNPTGPDSGTVRVLRGGGWSSPPDHLRVATRARLNPASSNYDVGFRCLSQDTDVNP